MLLLLQIHPPILLKHITSLIFGAGMTAPSRRPSCLKPQKTARVTQAVSILFLSFPDSMFIPSSHHARRRRPSSLRPSMSFSDIRLSFPFFRERECVLFYLHRQLFTNSFVCLFFFFFAPDDFFGHM